MNKLHIAVIASLLVFTSLANAQEQADDRFESVNRGVFWFNDQADTYVIKPVAQGYDAVVPDKIQNCVTNFFHNLRYPRYLVSDVIQGKFKQAFKDTGRFVVNSTVGLAGLFDIAEDMGLPEVEKDIGLALQYNGVPAGPYLVLPFLGPSNVRDAIGTIADFALDPLVIFGESSVRAGVRDPIYYAGSALKYTNLRSSLLEAIDSAKQSSVDYYLFMQGAYYQHRWGLLWDGNPPDEGDAVNYSPADKYAKDNGREAPALWREKILPPGAE